MNTIQFIQVTPEELENRILDGVKKIIESFEKPNDEKLMSRNEAAEFLEISSVTLWSWTSSGKIKSYGIGNRVYYKKSELIDALKPLKTK